MIWLLLASAILSEVTATVLPRFSDGFTKLVPSAVVVFGYGVSFVLLAQVLKRGMAVGVAYDIWSAIGVALIGAVFLGESLTWIQLGGLGLVIAGVAAVQSGATTH